MSLAGCAGHGGVFSRGRKKVPSLEAVRAAVRGKNEVMAEVLEGLRDMFVEDRSRTRFTQAPRGQALP